MTTRRWTLGEQLGAPIPWILVGLAAMGTGRHFMDFGLPFRWIFEQVLWVLHALELVYKAPEALIFTFGIVKEFGPTVGMVIMGAFIVAMIFGAAMEARKH